MGGEHIMNKTSVFSNHFSHKFRRVTHVTLWCHTRDARKLYAVWKLSFLGIQLFCLFQVKMLYFWLYITTSNFITKLHRVFNLNWFILKQGFVCRHTRDTQKYPIISLTVGLPFLFLTYFYSSHRHIYS